MTSPENQWANPGGDGQPVPPPTDQPSGYPSVPPVPPAAPEAAQGQVPTSPAEAPASGPQGFELQLLLSGEADDPSELTAFKKALGQAALSLAMQHGITVTDYKLHEGSVQTSSDESEPVSEAAPALPEKPAPNIEPLFSPEVQDKLDADLAPLLSTVKVEPYGGSDAAPLSDKVKTAFAKALEEWDIATVRDVALLGTYSVHSVLPQRVGMNRADRSVDAFIKKIESVVPEPIVAVRKELFKLEDEKDISRSDALKQPLYTVEQIAAFCNDPNKLSLDVVLLASGEHLPAIPDGWRGYGVDVFVEDSANLSVLQEACKSELSDRAVEQWAAAAQDFMRQFQAIHPPTPAQS